MNPSLRMAPSYRRAIFQALALQVVVVLLSAMTLDMGESAQICGFALIAFWGGALVMILRRRMNPTETDLALMRVGYLPVIVLTAYLAPMVWHWHGVG